jgi:hypothetical protein
VDATVAPLSDAAGQFLADYGSHLVPPGLEGLDHAWASWLDRQSVDADDPKSVINAVAVYFGQAVVDHLPDFAWVQATDEQGTDLAVHGLPGSADILLYPAQLVARQYEVRRQVFLLATFDEVVQRAEQLRGGR